MVQLNSDCQKIFPPKPFYFIYFAKYKKELLHKKTRDKILKKAHEKYHNGGGKGKAKKYYRENKEEIKKRERERYRKLDRFEKKDKMKRSLDRYYRLKKEREESE